jgi:hypothetical protein
MSQAVTVLAAGLPSPRSKTVRRLIIEDDEVQQIPAIDDSLRESRGSFEQLCESIPAGADGELSVDVTIDPDVICDYVDGSPVLTKLNLDGPTEEQVTRSESMSAASKDVSITSGESVSERSSSFADSPRGPEPQVEQPEIQKQEVQKPVAQRKSQRGSISHFVYSQEQFEAINKEAVVKFNLKPSDARRYLIDQNVITDDPVNFALWISSTPRLSKRRIGEFIGKEDDLNQQCCAALFASYDLQGSLDMALRQLMRQFRLPGEAQQIDRILQQFAEQYAQQNPDSQFSSETVYVLAFSVILLNTDLHNPSIPPHKKMTLEQFISNNRGIHDGRDIDRDYLVGLYERVQQQEIRMDEQDMWESEVVTFMAPIMSGWLSKKSDGLLGPWKTHWFVLTDGCLYYFLSPKDETPRCIIPLDNTRVNRGSYATDVLITPATGEIVKSSKLVQRSTMEQGRRTQFLLRARSRDDREAWVSALQVESERFRPLHDLFLRVQRQKQTSGAALGCVRTGNADILTTKDSCALLQVSCGSPSQTASPRAG